ncbi:uncharacterized protein BXZ73DRAFT_92162 [Epithele typhae]|uniref:uncharacterized protein n=1 Tax=Epithele typhae TaxID=378194 RepID=UPI002007BCAA|nr:uncharacterized protein BXZ73DRAFT_92162 [Epithele typhae]KAH9918734.1 hypothetical protein BXZ73DRAFT_92162 [Epithele typhae]
MSSFLPILSNSLLFGLILSHLTPSTLCQLLRVDRGVHTAVKSWYYAAFSINCRLARFFHDPTAFRSLQARTAAVISGSFALQFFARTYYPEADLDLFVHPNRDILTIGSFLQEELYVYEPLSWQLPDFKAEVERLCRRVDCELASIDDDNEFEQLYSMLSLRAVYTFRRAAKRGCEDSDERKVQIVVSRSSPLASVLDFHSTCVMNIITYNAAYSLYPYATFEQHEAVVINNGSLQAKAALVKYSARGWRIIANPSPLIPLLDRRAFHPNVPRWVCDGKTWMIPLDLDDIALPEAPSASSARLTGDPVAECGWMLEGRDTALAVSLQVLASTVLLWRYTVGCGDLGHWSVLIAFLKAQGKLEHMKIPSGKVKQDASDVWTWWDSVLPLFRKRFMEEHGLLT